MVLLDVVVRLCCQNMSRLFLVQGKVEQAAACYADAAMEESRCGRWESAIEFSLAEVRVQPRQAACRCLVFALPFTTRHGTGCDPQGLRLGRSQRCPCAGALVRWHCVAAVPRVTCGGNPVSCCFGVVSSVLVLRVSLFHMVPSDGLTTLTSPAWRVLGACV